MKIGVLEVGQAPMQGLLQDLTALIGPEHEFVQVGALDELSESELAALAPGPGEQVTVVQMRDGRETLVSSERLYSMGQSCITSLEQRGAQIILLACGGNLPEYDHRVPYLITFRALKAMIDLVLPDGTLALMIPSGKQCEKNQRWYLRPGTSVVIEGASPSSDEEIREAAVRLAEHRPDLIVMTCFAYDRRQREMVRGLVSCPVLLSRSVVCRAVAELAAGWPSH